MKIPIDNM
jgi:putative addiction module killer protein